jgi:stage V sporulation protein B
MEKSRDKAWGRENLSVLGEIVKIALPATLASLIISLTRVVDMIMMLRRLQDIGYTSEMANALYGSYTTMAIPIFSLAAALVTSISIPLIPSLGRSIADGDAQGQRARLECAISLCAYISCPAMLGISLFSREILELIFKNQSDGIEMISLPLALLGISVLNSVLISVTNAILQAYRRATAPIVSMLVGCGVKIVISYALIGNPGINILCAPIGTFVCDLIICILNFVFLSRAFDGEISLYKTLISPKMCAALSVKPAFFVMRVLQKGFDGNMISIICIALAGGLYLLLSARRIIKIKDLD